MSEPWKLVIAAGGTGGHVSPALAVGARLSQDDPSCRIEYVCGTRPVEVEIYRRAGIEPKVMEIQPLLRGLRGWLRNILNMRSSIATARRYLRTEKPDVVLGTGGYVCFPVLAAASGERIRTIILEQNAVAGRANLWLARRVDLIACAYGEAARAFPRSRTQITGNPVRPEFVGASREEGLKRWELDPDRPTVLVFGGSQGARRLNRFLLEGLRLLDETACGLGNLQLLWVCGEKNYADVKKSLESARYGNLTIRLLPFIREMGAAYGVADLVVGRAGAMTIAELTANGLPAILVPLPEATADHQLLNARPMAEAGAAVVLEERKLSGEKLARQIVGLLEDRAALEAMGKASRGLARLDAADRIVSLITRLREK